MKDFVVEVRCEPPKVYVDDLERPRLIEFVTYKTVIRQSEEKGGVKNE